MDRITIKDAEEAYPYFPWADFMKSILPENITVKEDEVVVFLSQVFDELEEMMSTTPKRTLANYFMWRVVAYSSAFLTHDLQRKIATYQSAVTGAKSGMQRSIQCTQATMES